MFSSSFSKIQTQILIVLMTLTGASQHIHGQSVAYALEPVEQPWYLGVRMGTSFGQCTFRSITESNSHWGFQGGLDAGYRLNRLISYEAGIQFGSQTQTALDCCQGWLSADGYRYLNPVQGLDGWYYHDIQSRTGWFKLSAQANIDVLTLIVQTDDKWSFNISPQLSAVTTKSKLITPESDITNDRQWHLGLGGQLSAGYRITDNISTALYGGITCLTGKRFDNIPEHFHKSNLIWDAGVKVSYCLDYVEILKRLRTW